MVDPAQIEIVMQLFADERYDNDAHWVLAHLSERIQQLGDQRKLKHKLTEAEVEVFCDEVKNYFANHWRDDDNPEIECKMRRSWWPVLFVAAVVACLAFGCWWFLFGCSGGCGIDGCEFQVRTARQAAKHLRYVHPERFESGRLGKRIESVR